MKRLNKDAATAKKALSLFLIVVLMASTVPFILSSTPILTSFFGSSSPTIPTAAQQETTETDGDNNSADPGSNGDGAPEEDSSSSPSSESSTNDPDDVPSEEINDGVQEDSSFGSNQGNQPPVADAGPNFSVDEGTTEVNLDGSKSYDPDGQTLQYQWQQFFTLNTQPAVTLSNARSATATFDAPEVNADVELVFLLTVADGTGIGALTDEDEVRVTIRDVPDSNHPPQASDNSILTDEDTPVDITLSANDSDSEDTLTFAIVDNPASGTLDNFDSAAGKVTYKPNENFNGEDNFTFKVNDGTEDSNIANVKITVNPINDIPMAALTASVSAINAGESVELDASASSDPDGNIMKYEFTQTGGPAGKITQSSTDPSRATFTAPQQVSSNEIISISVTVTDDGGATDQETVNIEIQHVNTAPTVILQANPSTINEGQTSILDASDSTDTEGDALIFTFEIVNGSEGSISNQDGATAVYNAPANIDSDRTIVVKVSADDGRGGISSSTVEILVKDLKDTTPPETKIESVSYYPTDDPSQRKQLTDGQILKLSSQTSVEYLVSGIDENAVSIDHFECQTIGQSTFQPCHIISSPSANSIITGFDTGPFSPNSLTFDMLIRAVDEAGNPDPTPARFTFTIDVLSPETRIVSAVDDKNNPVPDGSTVEIGSNYVVHVKVQATDDIKLDHIECTDGINPTPFVDCTTGVGNLNSDGTVTFSLSWRTTDTGTYTRYFRAVDAAGNVDPTPAKYTITISRETTPPETKLISANDENNNPVPDGSTIASTGSAFAIRLELQATDNFRVDHIECTDGINPTPFTNCSSFINDADLDGIYTFSLGFRDPGTYTRYFRAVDAAGNVDPTPAKYTLTITSGNSPTGTNVNVEPDETTSLTFSEIKKAGDTSVTSESRSGISIPGFELLSTVYDITTTAEWTPPLQVCIDYDDSQIPAEAESTLQMFHEEGAAGNWVQVTNSLDQDGNQICGSVSSLSRFAIAYEVPLPKWTIKGFYPPVDMVDASGDPMVNTLKSGRSVPLKFEVFDERGTELTSTGTDVIISFKPVSISCGTLADDPIDAIEVTNTGGTSMTYDSSTGQYIQNWKTLSNSAGKCFRADLETADGTHTVAYFKLTK